MKKFAILIISIITILIGFTIYLELNIYLMLLRYIFFIALSVINIRLWLKEIKTNKPSHLIMPLVLLSIYITAIVIIGFSLTLQPFLPVWR